MASNRALSIEDGDLSKFSIAATRNIEYVDLDLSLSIKPKSKDVYSLKEAESVKQALKILIMTNQGEKPFSPYFGANIPSYLFELADSHTVSDIETHIRSSILSYEPRIDSKSLRISAVADPDLNAINIDIIFQIINTTRDIEFTTRLNRLR